MDVLGVLSTAASGMDAQRGALEVAARNVAAAQAAGPKGTFERAVPEFRLIEREDGSAGVEFTGTHTQRGSDVDMLTEMVSVLNASRAYEANASVFEDGKQLAQRTIDMGRL